MDKTEREKFVQETIEQAIMTAPHKTVNIPMGKDLSFYYEKATAEDLEFAEELYIVDVEKGKE